MTSYKHTVQYYETDKMGITHHSNYIRWMEEARVDFLRQIGWNYEKLEENGIVSPVTAIECRYKSPTFFAETVNIDVCVEGFKGARLRLKYEMKKEDGTFVCDAHSEHCFMNKDGKFIRLQKEFPDFYKALMRFSVPEEQDMV
ncbi:MAG: acyl-CoA thioesterase [Eubacteriales bacterium]